MLQLTWVAALAALLTLAWGLLRHQARTTAAALIAIVLVGAGSVPILAGNEAFSAIVGFAAVTATALAALLTWRSTRRLPEFAAAATLLLGIAELVLLTSAVTRVVAH